MRGLHSVKKGLLRTAAVAAIALNAGGCSIMPDMPSVPDWVDPTTWFGSDSSDTAADNGQTPDLAGLPDKPSASTPDDQQKVAESLAADRSHAQYSAEALRGGTEAAAPPPPASPPAATEESLPGSANDLARSGRKAPVAAAPVVKPQVAQVDRSVIGAPSGSAAPGTLPSPGSAPSVAGAEPAVQVAQVPAPEPAPPVTPQGSQPAVAAAPSAPSELPAPSAPPPAPPPSPPMQVASIAPGDAALGFRASTAPALAPSVAQFVAPSIVHYYQQTSSRAAMHAAAAEPQARPRRSRRAMGGPAEMTGSVVANLGALSGIERSTPSVYANAQGFPAASVVLFPGDSVILNAQGRAKVRAAVEQYKSRGGQGYIRVVGHSSSRTPNMSLERHLEIIYRKSQERADAVARELIREGVPAAKVLVEAVGDSQPIYYESMPKGEEGNRRAEIFLQS